MYAITLPNCHTYRDNIDDCSIVYVTNNIDIFCLYHQHFLKMNIFLQKKQMPKMTRHSRIEFLPQQNIYYMTLLQMWQMWMIHFLQQSKSTLYLYKPEAEADFEGKTYLYDYCDCSIISWHAHTICLAIVNLINI